MTVKEALGALSNGHSIYKVKYAYEICKAMKVKPPKKLVQKWYSDKTGDPKGLHMNKEGDEGVYSLSLSAYVAGELGVADKARSCIGRGFQAQAYADVIKEKLKGGE